MVLVIWLNENVHFHARFLAMPKLMQAWFWSFGLTKTLLSEKGAKPCIPRLRHSIFNTICSLCLKSPRQAILAGG
jgi:hypothetical protein